MRATLIHLFKALLGSVNNYLFKKAHGPNAAYLEVNRPVYLSVRLSITQNLNSILNRKFTELYSDELYALQKTSVFKSRLSVLSEQSIDPSVENPSAPLLFGAAAWLLPA